MIIDFTLNPEMQVGWRWTMSNERNYQTKLAYDMLIVLRNQESACQTNGDHLGFIWKNFASQRATVMA